MLLSDYLQDQSFVRKTEYEGSHVNLNKLFKSELTFIFIIAELMKLKIFTGITFVLTLIVFTIFVTTNAKKMYFWLQKKKSTMRQKNTELETTKTVTTLENPNTNSPIFNRKSTSNQRNFQPTSSILTVSGTEFEQKTVSTPISRHPAEDTVDYFYDNKALQLTPTQLEENRKIETNF